MYKYECKQQFRHFHVNFLQNTNSNACLGNELDLTRVFTNIILCDYWNFEINQYKR